jgi:hypothetical protein
MIVIVNTHNEINIHNGGSLSPVFIFSSIYVHYLVVFIFYDLLPCNFQIKRNITRILQFSMNDSIIMMNFYYSELLPFHLLFLKQEKDYKRENNGTIDWY